MLLLFLQIALCSGVIFKFYIKPGDRQCFNDQLLSNTLIAGYVDASSSKFVFYINLYEDDYHTMIHETTRERYFDFHYIIEKPNQIKVCFESTDDTNNVKIKWKYETGAEALDVSQVAIKGQANEMDQTLGEMLNLQKNLKTKQQYLQIFEASREANQTQISNKIIAISTLVVLIVLIINAFQNFWVRRFILYKKLN